MDGMDSSHSKEGFFEGQVKKKRGLVFLGETKKGRIMEYKKTKYCEYN